MLWKLYHVIGIPFDSRVLVKSQYLTDFFFQRIVLSELYFAFDFVLFRLSWLQDVGTCKVNLILGS